jgi:hypothetical protein
MRWRAAYLQYMQYIIVAWMTKVRQVENGLQSYDNKSTKDTRLVYRRLGLQLL